MGIKLTGLASGLDTESMVKELTAAYNTKKDDMWKEQKQVEYKQQAWDELNAEVYEFYKDTLFDAKLNSKYNSSELETSNENVAMVSGKAVSGSQSLVVKQIATQTHITGGKFAHEPIGYQGSITVTMCGEEKQIDLTADMTGEQVAKTLSEVGLEANYDKVNGRLFLASKQSGLASDFSISGDADVLAAIGLDDKATKLKGQDAVVELNGAEFTFNSNAFEINKMKFNVKSEGSVTIGSKTTNSIFDMTKKFIEKYNDIIKKIDTAYNADYCDLKPLTDDERYVISDKQADDWEKKIKTSVLRKDETLGTLSSTLKNVMNSFVEIDGQKNSLYSIGIKTGNYLTTKQAERGVYLIDEDALKTAIDTDPEKVTSIVTGLASKLYDKLSTKMKSSSMKSAYTIYNDKQLKSKYNDYTNKLDKWSEKIANLEDKYYKQFAKMESMMAAMQTQQSYLVGLFGM